ncbi:MAG: Uma2 family endonuclease [Calothrix sp. C42_A2020_038]|nr:Uma2 family endonuclease [Calothrix sp. C42_A2020_038]
MVSQASLDVTEDTTPDTSLHLWTVEDYHRMIDVEILTEEHKVELLEGQIIEISAHQPPHVVSTQKTWKLLHRKLGDRAEIRVQVPVTLQPKSEPEPDVAVVRLDPGEYINGHPTPDDIFLIVEVADRTLTKDCTTKARTYAKAKIPEYWVVDVKSQQLYVFREPGKDNYIQQTILDINAKLSLLTFPDVEIEVKQLFP